MLCLKNKLYFLNKNWILEIEFKSYLFLYRLTSTYAFLVFLSGSHLLQLESFKYFLVVFLHNTFHKY